MGKRRVAKGRPKAEDGAPDKVGRRRLPLLVVALVVLGAGAVAVNGRGLRGWYLSRLPVERLAERAGRDGSDEQALEIAARRLLAERRPAEVRGLLEPRMEALADREWLQVLLGRACLETGALKEAAAHLKVALLLSRNDADAHWWLAETLRRQGRTEEAASHDLRVTELAPRRGEPWLRLGARALKLNQYTEALGFLNGAEERLRDGEVARLRARALWKLGRLDEAAAAARQAVAREPAPPSQLILGQLLAATARPADWREGVTYLRRVVEQEPRNDDAHRDLGLLYRQLGEHALAVKELRAHLQLNPGAARSYPPLAQSYLAMGKPALAARVLKIYRRLEPIEMKTAQAEYRVLATREAPQARLELARTYAECGFEDRARQELQTLLRAHPHNADAAKLLVRLPRRRTLQIEPLPADPEGD